jgi:hypothetical protein
MLVNRFAPVRKYGSSTGIGHVLVEYWSNTGQILVKYWSNTGQILVSAHRCLPPLAMRARPSSTSPGPGKPWSNRGQTVDKPWSNLAKLWSNRGQIVVK